MVSRVRYINLDGLMLLLRKNKVIILGVILVLSVVVAGFYLITRVFLPEIAIFTLFLIYLLFSPFMLKSLNTKS